MAYNPTSAYPIYLRRIVTGLADFKGRSRRSEFVVFLALMMAINALVLISTSIFDGDFSTTQSEYLELALWCLGIPLFARRLHDQGRSGWFALIVPPLIGLKLYGRILFDARQLPTPKLGYPFNVAEIMLVVVFWVLAVWPGTEGENRFGQDPRQRLAAT